MKGRASGKRRLVARSCPTPALSTAYFAAPSGSLSSAGGARRSSCKGRRQSGGLTGRGGSRAAGLSCVRRNASAPASASRRRQEAFGASLLRRLRVSRGRTVGSRGVREIKDESRKRTSTRGRSIKGPNSRKGRLT